MINIEEIRGMSAKCLISYLSGKGKQGGEYPHDESDLLRCFSALDQYPSLRADLPKMAEVNAYWAAIVQNWDALELVSHKGDMLKSIIAPIQAADPAHHDLGNGVSVQIGGATFNGTVPEAMEKVKEFLTEKFEGETGRKPKAERGQAKAKIPMKETEDDIDVRNNVYAVAADEIRQFVERAEQLAAEKRDIAEQEKELFAEAKGRGYSPKVMKKVIALRKRKADDIAEEEAQLDLYKSALGMV